MDETHTPQILDERDAVANYGIASIPVEQWDEPDYVALDEWYAEVEETQRSLQFPH